MLHVLVGSNTEDHRALQEAGLASVAWIVPKTASVGDRAILFTRAAGFVAFAEIASVPQSTTFGRRAAYEAQIGNVDLLAVPVPLAHIATQLPHWPWTTYPRSYTTIRDPGLVAELEALVEGHQSLAGAA